jgi:methylthioribulose 1-phosphate dehydratase/enolase-phosphatase E1
MDFDKEQEIRSLVCELCRQFYQLGWVTGTGGSISIRHEENIFMTPSGVQKERIQPDELFIVDFKGEIIKAPEAKGGGSAKLSDCAPLFLHAYNQRNAGAVLHSHGLYCNLVTLLCEGRNEFRISQQEMIKGIEGHGYFDELVIPIIENTAWEHELADSLGATIANYPKACAVLVRQHGMYVWGKTWEQAKRHGECLHYLFEAFVNAHKLGVSNLITKRGLNSEVSHVLLDIEGTTTPLAFVKQVLFPYSAAHALGYLQATWLDADTQQLVQELFQASQQEVSAAAPEVDRLDACKVAEYVRFLVAQDRKLGALKTLQGRIWELGYASGELKGQVFEDVARALRSYRGRLAASIYSSGSRQAQALLFRHSDRGDLTSCLSAYFDTTVGGKGDAASYADIALTLGVRASRVLFVTDVLAEARAAQQAGMQVRLSLRPGNAAIEEQHEFATVTTFDDLEL